MKAKTPEKGELIFYLIFQLIGISSISKEHVGLMHWGNISGTNAVVFGFVVMIYTSLGLTLYFYRVNDFIKHAPLTFLRFSLFHILLLSMRWTLSNFAPENPYISTLFALGIPIASIIMAMRLHIHLVEYYARPGSSLHA